MANELMAKDVRGIRSALMERLRDQPQLIEQLSAYQLAGLVLKAAELEMKLNVDEQAITPTAQLLIEEVASAIRGRSAGNGT